MIFANAFLVALWRQSLWAVAVVGLVLLVRTLVFRGALSRWRSLLWAIVLLRVALPTLPESRFSILNISRWFERPRSSVINGYEEPRPTAQAVGKTVITTGYLPSFESTKAALTLAPVAQDARRRSFNLIWLWLAGAALVIASRFIGHARFLRRLSRRSAEPSPELLAMLGEACKRMHVRRPPRLRITDVVSAPALAGLFRPQLLLPPTVVESLAPAQLRLVMLHELAHLRRMDLWIDAACTPLIALHWFNPAVWIASAMYRSDRELARDAMVIRAAGESEANAYGRAMVTLLERVMFSNRTPMTVVGILERWGGLKLRVSSVAAYRRTGFASAAIATAMFMLLGCTALTGQTSAAAPASKPSAASPATRPSAQTTARAAPPASPVQAADAQAQSLLDRSLPEVNFNATQFGDVIDFLRDVTSANLFVNWRALETAGITRDAPVTVRLRDVKFSHALEVILKDVGGGTVKLSYVVDDGVISISTMDDFARNTVTKTYDVHELLADVVNFDDAPKLGIAPTTVPTDKGEKQHAESRQQRADALVQLLQESVAPNTWDRKWIKEVSGQLIVTGTADEQKKVAAMLAEIRNSQSRQITIEARFQSFEQSEIDHNPRLRKILGELGKADRAGNSSSALLDDEAVKTILDAAKGDRSSVAATPRITLFNGQRAYVMSAQETAYVADLKLVRDAKGEAGYEPVIGKVTAGCLLDAQAMVSADGGHVTLTLRPQISELVGLHDVPFKGKSPDGSTLTIQRPLVNTSSLQTTVSLPNRATILLGGFSEAHALDAPKVRRFLLVRTTIISQKPDAPAGR